MGATHAANFMFRRPDIFQGCICLSGYYDSDLFLVIIMMRDFIIIVLFNI